MIEIIKIGLLGIIGVLFAGWFKGSKPEYTLYIGVGAALLIFSYVVRFFYSLIARLLDLQAYME
ncbi:MAG: stage III sporulation protein AD, partial [Lachnospiraceae bacterium]|nr:stage III sporulation protein AD [Lachnospiraceae bacterium]